MAAPSQKEIELLSKFRSALGDLKLEGDFNTDVFLLRWLRARDLNLKKAEQMIRDYMKFRDENDQDNILTWEAPELYPNEFKYDITGYTPELNPVVFIPLGRWDIKYSVCELGQKDIYVKYVDQLFERATNLMKGKIDPNNQMPVTQLVVVFDMDKYSYSQLTAFGATNALLETVRHFESNFPETLKSAIVINAPKVFSILFSLVKPLLTARTLGKVVIYGHNNEKWKPILYKAVPLSAIPTNYGGTCEKIIMNQNGEMNVGFSGWVKNGDEDSEYDAITVEAGQKLKIEYEIDQENTTLSWKFRTDGFDIGFSVLYTSDLDSDDENSKASEVVPYERFDSHMKHVEGSYVCSNPGRYFLCFDNSYSRMRAKTLHYFVDFEVPLGDQNGENGNVSH